MSSQAFRFLSLAESIMPIRVSRIGLHADEGQDAALQALQPVRAEIPAIEQGRHPHRHDDAGGAALEQRLQPLSSVRWAKPGRNTCSKKPLSKAGIIPSHSG